MKRLTKVLILIPAGILALVIGLVLSFVAFIYIVVEDHYKFPVSHIRNDRWIVGVYDEAYVKGRGDVIVTVVDLQSYRRSEKVRLRFWGYSTPRLNLQFVDSTHASVSVDVCACSRPDLGDNIYRLDLQGSGIRDIDCEEH